jgi:hypothetical protein
MLPDDLPPDLPSFVARFGSDEQCHAYLFRQRWPEGFACRACGQRRAWRLGRRNIYECAACGQQHSLLKGTIFEQTKTGLARWFLAIYLVSASKGGISALELQRHLGFRSYQTAWTWLHKLRRAMIRPHREPLGPQIEADETYLGGSEPGSGAAARAARLWSPGLWRAAAARGVAGAWGGCGSPPCPMPRAPAWRAFSPPTSPARRP